MKECSIALIGFIFLFVSGSFAQTHPLPYVESFDSYPVNQPLNGDGGIAASSHVYVTPYGVAGNCAEFQMADTAATDTITSPVIGPLTLTTTTSFYFRAVTFSGGVPSVYHMSGTDKSVIYVGGLGGTGSLYIPQLTIDSADQNTTTNYVKVTIAVPTLVNGYTGRFKIITSNPAGNNWKLEFDSLVVADTALVSPPPVLRDSLTNINCRGQSTGGIKVIASGYPPYTYLWSPGGDTTDAISGVPAGVYSVTVTDSVGGAAILTDTIRQPAFALLLDSLSRTGATCYGSSTGSATIYASGGTTPYQYAWSTIPISMTDSAEDLAAGNYSVTVTDAHGCIVTASVHITQPSVPFTTSASSTQSSSGNNGTAAVTVTNGAGPYSYTWSTVPVQTTAAISGLAPGLYEVTVTDGSGCEIVDTVFVAFPNGVISLSTPDLRIYPNPARDIVYFDIDGINPNQLKVTCTDMMGRTWEFEDIMNNSINIGALATGLYMIKITMPSHCYSQKLLIER